MRSLYATGDIPWTDVLISGHALDPAGKKISKSKLKAAEDPTAMLQTFSADAVRYWATSVRTGGDTLLSDEVMKNGNRLVTKLWNAAKLALGHVEGYVAPDDPSRLLNATDLWLLARLHTVIRRATTAMEEYEFAAAKTEVERFFWTDLCDNYLEMIKFRLYGDAEGAEGAQAGREGARYANGRRLRIVRVAPTGFDDLIVGEPKALGELGVGGEAITAAVLLRDDEVDLLADLRGDHAAGDA